MSYHNVYLAQKLYELQAANREKSLYLARMLAEGSANRAGFAERLLDGAGGALISMGQKLKERNARGGDLSPEWYW